MTEENYIKAVEANKIPEDDVIGVDVNGYNLAV
jgi:3-phenylpropionate/trans-cinnamate dioxygenase ferredoxin subunit/naphthalene 1,2-dioxygenase system ferredoxin subunit